MWLKIPSLHLAVIEVAVVVVGVADAVLFHCYANYLAHRQTVAHILPVHLLLPTRKTNLFRIKIDKRKTKQKDDEGFLPL